jgi:NAD(P)-dependent dehydrogenase (short-subunit alcohol dehydrogenase family)
MQDGALHGSIAFVTGASRGIGRAAALALADSGADVAVNARTEADLQGVADEIRARGRRAAVCTADVTDTPAMQDAVRRAEEALGPLDVVVANAGVAWGREAVWEVDPSLWWEIQRVNVLGVLNTVRAAVPGMVARGHGRVIHVASYAGIRPQKHGSAYATSKAALLRLHDCLAEDLEDTGVVSLAMSPGMVRTDMTRDMIRGLGIEEDRLTPIEEGAKLIVRLASGEADALSGRMIHVTDDLDAMIAAADEIRERKWYQLRLVRGLEETTPV